MDIRPIGHIESPYPTKFGVPRQPGLVRSLVSWLVLDGDAGSAAEAARDQVAGARAGDYLWLVWAFSKNLGRAGTAGATGASAGARWSPTVRPPRLGGNRRVGVFATRSSFRPNELAISAVQVAGTEGAVPAAASAPAPASAATPARIPLAGADMVDGTPVYALRRYDPARDCIEGATSGWLARHDWPELRGVVIPEDLEKRIPPELRAGVRELLCQDPRPAYTRATQPDREFWVPVGRLVVWFRVESRQAVVTRVRELDEAAWQQLKEKGTI